MGKHKSQSLINPTHTLIAMLKSTYNMQAKYLCVKSKHNIEILKLTHTLRNSQIHISNANENASN